MSLYEAVGGDGVAVVLGGDVDAAGRDVLHRVVGAAMAEFQLEGACLRTRGRAPGARGSTPRIGAFPISDLMVATF